MMFGELIKKKEDLSKCWLKNICFSVLRAHPAGGWQRVLDVESPNSSIRGSPVGLVGHRRSEYIYIYTYMYIFLLILGVCCIVETVVCTSCVLHLSALLLLLLLFLEATLRSGTQP